MVKGWSHTSFDKEGKPAIHFQCSDIDKAGHTTANAAAAMKKSFDQIALLVPGIKLASLEGDAGGGGSVQSTYKALVDQKVMEKSTRFINYGLRHQRGGEVPVHNPPPAMSNTLDPLLDRGRGERHADENNDDASDR